jgi:hypothetical protein
MKDNFENGIFRRRKNSFAAVSNSALQDKKLSLRAKGLYALIQSYINIPNYTLRKSYLMTVCTDGKKSFDSGWNELKNSGYLKVYRIPGGNRGRFVYQYELLDSADTTTPPTINISHNGTVNDVQKNTAVAGTPDTPEMDPKHEDIQKPASALDSDHIPEKGYMVTAPKKQPEKVADHIPPLAYIGPSNICSGQYMLKGGYLKRIENKKNNLKKKNIRSVSLSKEEGIKTETDGQTDKIRERLKNQVEYDYLLDRRPDDGQAINVLIDCMAEMLLSPATKINGTVQSRMALKPYIDQVSSDDVLDFFDHMRGKPMKDVRNISAYWRSAFINYLREQEFIKATL